MRPAAAVPACAQRRVLRTKAGAAHGHTGSGAGPSAEPVSPAHLLLGPPATGSGWVPLLGTLSLPC